MASLALTISSPYSSHTACDVISHCGLHVNFPVGWWWTPSSFLVACGGGRGISLENLFRFFAYLKTRTCTLLSAGKSPFNLLDRNPLLHRTCNYFPHSVVGFSDSHGVTWCLRDTLIKRCKLGSLVRRKVCSLQYGGWEPKMEAHTDIVTGEASFKVAFVASHMLKV